MHKLFLVSYDNLRFQEFLTAPGYGTRVAASDEQADLAPGQDSQICTARGVGSAHAWARAHEGQAKRAKRASRRTRSTARWQKASSRAEPRQRSPPSPRPDACARQRHTAGRSRLVHVLPGERRRRAFSSWLAGWARAQPHMPTRIEAPRIRVAAAPLSSEAALSTALLSVVAAVASPCARGAGGGRERARARGK